MDNPWVKVDWVMRQVNDISATGLGWLQRPSKTQKDLDFQADGLSS